MEEQVRFVPEYLLLHLPRLEETAIIRKQPRLSLPERV